MPCLTIIDVTGIQNYIFGSNRLKEIIGGSEIVAQATSWWIFDVLRDELKWKTNLKQQSNQHKSPFDVIDENLFVENLDAEIIYAGGGNTLILFANRDKAKDFTEKYTLKLLKEASGLETVISHSEEFEMSNGKIISKVAEYTFEELNIKKVNRKVSTPLLGLAVSAQCVSTGGVATQFDKLREKYISTESYQKQDFAKKGNKRLREEVLEQLDWKGLEVPFEFDDLGRTKDEASYMAVVHTDGNGMGKRVEKVGESATDNRNWITQMRRFSKSIYDANVLAMQKTIDYLLNDRIDETGKVFNATNGESFNLSQKEVEKDGRKVTETYFPFRPLIFGGDDLTFVCDGRIALALTAFYFKKLKEIKLSDSQEPIYSRAGISIIKTHYPFRRAYELAEDLAKSAKSRIKEIDETEKKVFAMDWHVAMSGLLGSLDEIREREYTPELDKSKINKSERRKKILEMRPIVLENSSDPDDWRNWNSFIEIISEFQGDKWKDKRNKVKRLREVLREGSAATKEFLTLFKEKLPTDIADNGWKSDRCVHFDAIEMLDLFYPLEKIEEKASEANGE